MQLCLIIKSYITMLLLQLFNFFPCNTCPVQCKMVLLHGRENKHYEPVWLGGYPPTRLQIATCLVVLFKVQSQASQSHRPPFSLAPEKRMGWAFSGSQAWPGLVSHLITFQSSREGTRALFTARRRSPARPPCQST